MWVDSSGISCQNAEVNSIATSGISIGLDSECIGARGIAIGQSAGCQNTEGIAFGRNTLCKGDNSVAIGSGSNTQADFAVSIGRSITGGGTSSATPQVASGAALWIAMHREELDRKGYTGTWKQVEAVRNALFKSADKSYPQYESYYGRGALKAFDALKIGGT